MGFSDYFIQNVSITPDIIQTQANKYNPQTDYEVNCLSDQEILESTEDIYFNENVNTDVHELNVSNLNSSVAFIV